MSLDVRIYDGAEEVYHANITHNLGKMAEAAGMYQALWRPDEHGWMKASDIESMLVAGLRFLIGDPKRFEALAPANGWGTYDDLVEFTWAYLKACRAYPNARIEASR